MALLFLTTFGQSNNRLEEETHTKAVLVTSPKFINTFRDKLVLLGEGSL